MPKKITLEDTTSIHYYLLIAQKLVYNNCGLVLKNLELNQEGVNYGACSFQLNEKKIQHRVSKITPTKLGQFVTIWKRNNNGIIAPYHSSDNFDFIIITTKSNDNFGLFIFPKSALILHKIITNEKTDGKLGMRVYPPWDKVMNKQALKTQTWQINYFLPIHKRNSTNLELAKKLLT